MDTTATVLFDMLDMGRAILGGSEWVAEEVGEDQMMA